MNKRLSRRFPFLPRPGIIPASPTNESIFAIDEQVEVGNCTQQTAKSAATDLGSKRTRSLHTNNHHQNHRANDAATTSNAACLPTYLPTYPEPIPSLRGVRGQRDSPQANLRLPRQSSRESASKNLDLTLHHTKHTQSIIATSHRTEPCEIFRNGLMYKCNINRNKRLEDKRFREQCQKVNWMAHRREI